MGDETRKDTHREGQEHQRRKVIEGSSIEVHEDEHHKKLAGHMEEGTAYGKGIYGDLLFEGLMKDEHDDE